MALRHENSAALARPNWLPAEAMVCPRYVTDVVLPGVPEALAGVPPPPLPPRGPTPYRMAITSSKNVDKVPQSDTVPCVALCV